jgi:hypothetical protein
MGRIVHYLIVLLSLMCLFVTGSYTGVAESLTNDPEKAVFVYEDLNRFIEVHKQLTPEADWHRILQTQYLDRGSPGLKQFIEKYDLTADRLVKAIQKHPQKYGILNVLPPWLKEQEKRIRAAYVKLKAHIPGVQYFPTYFVVAGFRGIGSGSEAGQLISVEKFSPGKKSLDTLVVHELVHMQQVLATGLEKYRAIYGPEKSLLALTIREGTAEFFADLATGRMTQEGARAYVTANEETLWKKFQQDMLGSDTGDWMWKKPTDPQQPMHVAYVLGGRIVAAFYRNAADKARAVEEILSVTDYPAFLRKSRYGEAFEN